MEGRGRKREGEGGRKEGERERGRGRVERDRKKGRRRDEKQHSQAFGSPPHSDRWSAVVIAARRKGFPSVRAGLRPVDGNPDRGARLDVKQPNTSRSLPSSLSLSLYLCLLAHASLGLSHRPQRSFHVS
jgi:hypothetical protein